MNNRRNRDEKLLTGLFHDDWSNGPAAKFALRAAAHARARRRVRFMAAAGAVGLAFACVFGLAHRPSPPSAIVLKSNPPPAYEIISDAELLARLHDRPLLVLEKQNGTKEFVLLDR